MHERTVEYTRRKRVHLAVLRTIPECCLLGRFSFIFTVEACRFYDVNSSTCTCNSKPGICELVYLHVTSFLPSYLTYPTYVLTVTRLVFRCERFSGVLSAFYEFLCYIATNYRPEREANIFRKKMHQL